MTTAAADFAKRLDQTAEETERLLAQLLSDTLLPDEIARPKRLMDAMRYSSLGGGKRLRPFLVVESSAVFGAAREAALLAGAALECIHCYSLIHDDLPAMDNSDLRRGRPTLHQKTDDATAILAGRSARPSRSPTTCSTSRATRRRSASRPDRTQHSARPPSSPNWGSTAPNSASAIFWPAPIPRCRSSAPGAMCCAPPRALSP